MLPPFRGAGLGTTILLVTHSTEQITRHCDRAILLEGGVVHQEGPPKDVANTYLDLLFGVQRKVEDTKKAGKGDDAKDGKTAAGDALQTDQDRGDAQGAVEQEEGTAASTGHDGASAAHAVARGRNTSPLSLLPVGHPPGRFEERPGYNSDEYRWGSREVEIVDFMVTTNGVDHTVRLNTGEQVMVVAWVRFRVDVPAPIYGLTIKTPDGVTVYGSNSRDFPDGPVMQPARAGQTVRVVFSLDLRIGAGDFLLSLGVAQEIGGGEVEPLDRRYDSILMHVSRQSRCYGLADFDMRVDIQADT